MKQYFYAADILLPDFGSKINGTKWATVACDQHTSEPEYWNYVEKFIGDEPSTLKLMLPEIWLSESAERIPGIRESMNKYLSNGTLKEHKNCGIYLERVQSDGRVRRGIIGCIDLEDYDYLPGSDALIRSTEKTVTERIPPRLAVRRGAPVEMPHVMLLIDDPEDCVIGSFKGRKADAYSFELMEKGGSVKGSFISGDEFPEINEKLGSLIEGREKPILFAVGDGNHSLATAKAAYEEIKKEIGADKASKTPARYALVEVVNIHDSALEFEPIYRICKGNSEKLIAEFEKHAKALNGSSEKQKFTVIIGNTEKTITVDKPEMTLPIATLQKFLDAFIADNPDTEIDYIHGEQTLKNLSRGDDCVGFLFNGMSKSELFPAVEKDGNLPRKTFSMGHAEDKRYYIEVRKIL